MPLLGLEPRRQNMPLRSKRSMFADFITGASIYIEANQSGKSNLREKKNPAQAHISLDNGGGRANFA